MLIGDVILSLFFCNFDFQQLYIVMSLSSDLKILHQHICHLSTFFSMNGKIKLIWMQIVLWASFEFLLDFNVSQDWALDLDIMLHREARSFPFLHTKLYFFFNPKLEQNFMLQ